MADTQDLQARFGTFHNAAGALTGASGPNSVTSIANDAFVYCQNLSSVTIPNTVTNIGTETFFQVANRLSVYFTGNAPPAGPDVFDNKATAYYLPGATGWSEFSTETGIPTVLWNPLLQTGGASFGVESNQFGFNIAGTNNYTVVVEACTNLASPVWIPLQTVVVANGFAYFSDPQWTNYPSRYYRISPP